jgi:hypothetical protein
MSVHAATGSHEVVSDHQRLFFNALIPFLGFDGAIEQRTGLPGEDLPSWTLATRPGDALVWDFRLMHAAYGSTAPRRQITLNFCEVPPPAADPALVHAQRANPAQRARDDLARPASSLSP